MARNFGTLKPHEVARNDHPLTILPNATENAFRMRVKENIDILWGRVNLIIQDLRGVSSPQELVSARNTVVTAIVPGGGVLPPVPSVPGIDEFRHAASLVNFQYDYYELTRVGLNVTMVVFKLVGATIATLTISYNTENQPLLFNMTGGNTGTLAMTYNNDGYLTSAMRT